MGSKYFVQGYPSYFLRTDIEENNRQVFSLFLKQCAVPEYFIGKFFTWLPTESMLSFRNLEEKLKEFQASHLQTGQKQGETKDYDIFYYVLKSCRYILCYFFLYANEFYLRYCVQAKMSSDEVYIQIFNMQRFF